MSQSEAAVLAIFRRFGVAPYQMLFLNANVDVQLQAGMLRLIKRGWVVRERHRHAYHLTTEGHKAMCSAERAGTG